MTTILNTTTSCFATALAIGAFACGPEETALLEMTATELGSAGGIARSSDGLLSIEFAEGALTRDTEITVTVLRDQERADVVSPVYELGPDGLQFDGPVTLSIEASGETGILELANLDEASPMVLADSTQSGNIVSGTLEHFSSYGVVAGATPNTLAEVTGGTTNVLLDLPTLSAAGLDVSGFAPEVLVPGNLGQDSVAFPINSRTSPGLGTGRGDAPTTFVYDFMNFAPVSGAIEHDGQIFFDQQFAAGNFTIGFDAARASGANSGFFVESTTEGFLLIPGVFFDIETPTFVDAQATSLTIEADLLVSAELASFLRDPSLEGADVGDARVSATAQTVTP